MLTASPAAGLLTVETMNSSPITSWAERGLSRLGSLQTPLLPETIRDIFGRYCNSPPKDPPPLSVEHPAAGATDDIFDLNAQLPELVVSTQEILAERLHNEVVLLAAQLAPRREEKTLRKWVLGRLRTILAEHCRGANVDPSTATLHVVGSHFYGPYLPNTGLDLLINLDTPSALSNQNFLARFVNNFFLHLKNTPTLRDVIDPTTVQETRAGDAIPRVHFRTKVGRLHVHIYFNRPALLEARETMKNKLIRHQEYIFPSALVIKYWFCSHDHSDVDKGGLSGYVLTNMLLMLAQRFGSGGSGPPCESKDAILGWFLLRFLEHYGFEFKPQTYAINTSFAGGLCLRTSNYTDKWRRGRPDVHYSGADSSLQVYDPLESDNNMTSRAWRWDNIRGDLQDTYGAIKHNHARKMSHPSHWLLESVLVKDKVDYHKTARDMSCEEWRAFIRRESSSINHNSVVDMIVDDHRAPRSSDPLPAYPIGKKVLMSAASKRSANDAKPPLAPARPGTASLVTKAQVPIVPKDVVHTSTVISPGNEHMEDMDISPIESPANGQSQTAGNSNDEPTQTAGTSDRGRTRVAQSSIQTTGKTHVVVMTLPEPIVVEEGHQVTKLVDDKGAVVPQTNVPTGKNTEVISLLSPSPEPVARLLNTNDRDVDVVESEKEEGALSESDADRGSKHSPGEPHPTIVQTYQEKVDEGTEARAVGAVGVVGVGAGAEPGAGIEVEAVREDVAGDLSHLHVLGAAPVAAGVENVYAVAVLQGDYLPPLALGPDLADAHDTTLPDPEVLDIEDKDESVRTRCTIY